MRHMDWRIDICGGIGRHHATSGQGQEEPQTLLLGSPNSIACAGGQEIAEGAKDKKAPRRKSPSG